MSVLRRLIQGGLICVMEVSERESRLLTFLAPVELFSGKISFAYP